MTLAASSTETAGPGVLERAARGDEAAFTRIIETYHADMARVCYVVCGDLDQAEEAAAAAWAVAWRKLDTVRDPERLRPWLVAVAANEARQVVRRRRNRWLREIPVAQVPLGDLVAPAEGYRDLDLANALARLSVEDRELLAMRYVAGLNATDLGRVTGRSASGTRARLQRLLRRLRAELGDD